MNILAIDCACEVLSAALAVGNEVFYTEIDVGLRHSELLMECVDTLCTTAGFSPRDLNLVACVKGPGSFTGLRIGYAGAKGIALALGIPLRAVPTMECLVYPLSIWPGMVLPAIDAKRGCFFAAPYRDGKGLADCMDAPPAAIAEKVAGVRLSQDEPVLLTGPGAELLFPGLAAHVPGVSVDPDCRRGLARNLLEIARSRLPEETNDIDSGPVYIRKSDAEEKL